MDVYITTKNDPLEMVYIGTSFEDAITAVGEFAKYQRNVPEARLEMNTWAEPGWYTIIPYGTPHTIMKYYMADGWWYTIVKITFEPKSF